MVYTLTLEGQEEFDKSIKWNGEIGKINKDIILKYLSDELIMLYFIYIYGPPGLLNAMKNLLTIELSITKDRIREEEFYGY